VFKSRFLNKVAADELSTLQAKLDKVRIQADENEERTELAWTAAGKEAERLGLRSVAALRAQEPTNQFVKNLDALQKAWKTLDIERYHLEGEVRAAKVPSVPHIINPKEIKQLVDKATILVTRGGKVYAYPDYDPDSEHYTHSSLFNQVHSELETEETGDYVKVDDVRPSQFLDIGGITAFSEGNDSASIRIGLRAPDVISRVLDLMEYLNRGTIEFEYENTDDQKDRFYTIGPQNRVRQELRNWRDELDEV